MDARIAEHRTAGVTLTVTADGAPLAGREVTVAQRSHAFRFGCTGFEFIPLANGEPDSAALEPVAERWLELFDFATLPFYWGRFEPVRGRPDTARLRRCAEWFVERGCLVKGHPLAWHTVTADWLRELSNPEILAAQLDRIRREVGEFAGVIDVWDVINEVVIMPIFDRYDNGLTRVCRDRGRIGLIRDVFAAARETNPQATLLLNDFDMSAAYECLIEGVLEAGVRIDALGLQSHMHQGYWGEEKTLATLDRFARYGLPIHFTETTIVSGEPMPPEIVDLNDFQPEQWPSTEAGEARQADEIVRHYRTLLSHPSVQAMTYWGISDGGWLGAPGGFLRADGTPKPAYHALHKLIKDEWWVSPTALVTDDAGQVRFRGFLGEYDISVADTTATVSVDTPGQAAAAVAL
ncbi:endo-1,4-beta-xylanase [Natronosporangium hydrolyticum]|uniref:Beta-xylanase n=1 Tax=Natronosporangium hydrolyticum TaxID=2811111 RepID=A0A895YMF9_9ACTN|nr:endo-1,4-beta-xylanase [Natronosporangium hydrolyticum]